MLTGKQRIWCSDACRKRTERRIKKSVRKSKASSANVREFYLFELKLKIIARATEPFLNWKYGSYLGITGDKNRQAWARMIRAWLMDEVPGFDFEVQILRWHF